MIPSYVNSYDNETERLLCLQWFIDNRHRLDKSKRTVIFLSSFDLASRQYRVVDAMRGLVIYYPDKYNVVLCEKPEHVDMESVDILFVNRIDGAFLKLIEELLVIGKSRFVFDMDDSLYRDKSHPTEKVWVALRQDRLGEELATAADCVMVTQKHLQEQISQFNPNVFVIRNSIDFNLPQWNRDVSWRENQNKDGKIVIGWAGGNTHLNVLLEMKKFLKPLHDAHKNLHLIIAGLPTEDFFIRTETNEKEGYVEVFKAKALEKDTFAYKLKRAYSDFDQSRIEFLDAVPISEYGKFFSMLNINLAYLHDNDFNQCKSENKIIEGLAYAAIPVYSNVGGYKEFYEALPKSYKNENCVIYTNDPAEWIEKISLIIKYFSEFRSLANQMSDYVKYKYSIKYSTDNRVAVFEELIKTL